MHSDKAYLKRIFQMPRPDQQLELDLQSGWQQLLDTVPQAQHGVVLALLEKQSKIQADLCVRSFIQGYELAVGIEQTSKRLHS